MRVAFDYARENGRKKVTAVHKANIMKYTDGLWLAVATEVAKEYPDIEFEERIVDNMCMQLVQKPELYDVLVLPNLYGDILSDLGAGLVGGLASPRAPTSAPTRRSSSRPTAARPKYKGQNKVNPTALMLSGMLMLRHLGEIDAADRLEDAVADVIREGKYVTYDLKPHRDDPTAVGTSEVARRAHREAPGDRVSGREGPAPRRRHRRRRPDRLQHPPPHRRGRDVRQGPAGHPAAARDPGRQGPEGARRASPWSSTTAPSRCSRAWC